MLEVAFEERTILIEYSFEVSGVDDFLAVGLGASVYFEQFLKQDFLALNVVFEILLFQVAAEQGGSNEALQHCIHVAGIPDVRQP